MALDKEELENLKQVTSLFVLFYKNIWNEVEKQFQFWWCGNIDLERSACFRNIFF